MRLNIRYLMLGLLCISISGCTRYASPVVAQDADEQEARMRYYLEETSPRNSTGLPRVTPEFKKTYGGSSTAGGNPDVPVTKQSEDDSESW